MGGFTIKRVADRHGQRRVRSGPSTDTTEALARAIIRAVGEDPDRARLRRTAARFVRSLRHLTSGSEEDVHAIVRSGIVSTRRRKMVLVRDIPIVSLCEHHVLPFFGRCHVAYIPDRKVLRQSNLARLIDSFCRRLQVQERLTSQIATTLGKIIEPRGVGVVIEAAHLCMMMRGVEKANTQAVTSSMLGLFRTHPKTRDELLRLISHRPTT
jgi:GTP cyclohydrolase I